MLLRLCCSRGFICLDLSTLYRHYIAPASQRSQSQGLAWLAQHPQRLLFPSRRIQGLLNAVLNWWEYDPDDGFVGFGANLLHLNSRLLDMQFTVKAKSGGCS